METATVRRSPLVFEAVLAGLAIIAIVAAVVVYRWSVGRVGELVEERDALTARLEDRVEEPRTGGAEAAPPAVQETSGAWTFPIAESDFLTFTSPHGYRVSPLLGVELYHYGVDIAAVWRAQVVAVADGTVVEHWPPPDGYFKGHAVYGGMILIEHADGWRSLYAHLHSTRVHTGQRVRAGQVIGRVGSTGMSRGAHLHVELHDAEGKQVNPLLHLSAQR